MLGNQNSTVERIRTLLEKTRVLLADGEISILERDIIKEYLREIYQYVDGLPHSNQSTIQTSEKPQEILRKEAIAKPVAPKQNVTTTIQEIPKPQANPIAPSIHYEQPKVKIETKEIPKPPPPKPKTPDFSQSSAMSPKVEKLFGSEATNELSDILSKQPIAQLKQSFSINDRLQYIQLLFDGDQHAFDICIRTIDDCVNLPHAKKYLEQQIIGRYDWTKDEKEELATSFIHLVKRRFSESLA